MRDLNRDVNSLLEPFSGSFNPATEPATACALLVNHLSMRRNKRCLLAYHRVRTDKLEEMCWNGVDVIGSEQTMDTSANASDANKSSLSPEEEEYVRLYSDLLAAYKGQWTDIDLTGSLEPPTDLFIDVRVLKDAGEIQTEYGYVLHGCFLLLKMFRFAYMSLRAINLTKNSQFYVRQGDVERLIQQGYLQKLS